MDSGRVVASICLLGVVVNPFVLSVDSAAFGGGSNQTPGTPLANETTNTPELSLGVTDALSGSAEAEVSDFSGDNGHVEKSSGYMEASMQQLKNAPCEMGYPCKGDQWCSPKRLVCRPCSDVEPWCNDTDTIHNIYPTCERYCYDVLRRFAEICETQKEAFQEQLQNKESQIRNLTQKAAREEAAKLKLMSQLEKQGKPQEGLDSTVAGLAVALTIAGVWALVVSARLYCDHCLRPHRDNKRVANQDPEALQAVQQSDDSGKLLLSVEEARAPVQDNTQDSGQLHFSGYGPGTPRVTGDAEVTVT